MQWSGSSLMVVWRGKNQCNYSGWVEELVGGDVICVQISESECLVRHKYWDIALAK